MKDGFIQAAAVTPTVKVADCEYNTCQIIGLMEESAAQGNRIVVFPELVVTGYTCSDLFWQETLLEAAKASLRQITQASEKLDALFFIGLPMEVNSKLYNVAAAISRGKVLGFVPKQYLPSYNEFYETRHFTPGCSKPVWIDWEGEKVPFGQNILFTCEAVYGLKVAAEICEDLWVPLPPSTRHAMAGANVIVNLSASDAVTGKSAYRHSLVSGQSARLICAYLYADAGEGESSQDLVFAGHNLIAENGSMLADSGEFAKGILSAQIDIQRLRAERRRMTTYQIPEDAGEGYVTVPFCLNKEEVVLTRYFDPQPFVPHSMEDRSRRCEEILSIQALGLKKRLAHIGCKTAVIGISGGLDSTLALLVTVRAFDMLGLPHSGIVTVTMPGFGTTDRTYNNACEMTRALGCDLREISIAAAVTRHFEDIGHDSSVHDVTYENSQARERTQILMDMANKTGGIVVGTGDLSELALGWATYNGDHMSMYGVNASIPKTLVRHLVRYYADTCNDDKLRTALLDVLDTPVSPELLPPKDGVIAQITEDLVGPYELHDFFLYYVCRFGFAPDKVYRIAKAAFAGSYEDEVILKWLKKFYWRFFSQQYKRSCLPDGPKVGSVALSPRGDLRMPSDAVAAAWVNQLENM